MKASAMVNCTLANEILRHRSQADGSGGSNNIATFKRLDRPRLRTKKNLSCELETPTEESNPQQARGRPSRRNSTSGIVSDLRIKRISAELLPAVVDDSPGEELGPSSSPRHGASCENSDNADPKPATTQRRHSNMWRPGLIALDQNSVIAALQLRAERDAARSPPATPRAQSVVSVNFDRRSHATTSRPPSRAPSRPPSRTPSRRPSLVASSPILSIFQFAGGDDQEFHEIGSLDDRLESKTLVACPESPNEFMSPKSDTTMVEEPESYSPQEKAIEDMRAYMSDYSLEKPLRSADAMSTPSPTPRRYQQRNLSDDAVINKNRPNSVPFRARAKTGNGMLELRANSTRDCTPTLSKGDKHRRKMSLNLPVKAAIPEAECVEISPPIKTSRSDKFPRKSSPVTVTPAELSKEERELSYKHRHTFIGTASLEDFIELLEVSAGYNTTKEAVAKAFILLAAHEQLYARQCSTSQEGWDLVHKIKPEDKYIDYLAQLQVKLGSITLRQFLALIHFDEKEEINAVRAVEAFSVASHMDAKAGSEMGSKAKAFRSWLLTQKA